MDTDQLIAHSRARFEHVAARRVVGAAQRAAPGIPVRRGAVRRRRGDRVARALLHREAAGLVECHAEDRRARAVVAEAFVCAFRSAIDLRIGELVPIRGVEVGVDPGRDGSLADETLVHRIGTRHA